jgi:hypothetical protein
MVVSSKAKKNKVEVQYEYHCCQKLEEKHVANLKEFIGSQNLFSPSQCENKSGIES